MILLLHINEGGRGQQGDESHPHRPQGVAGSVVPVDGWSDWQDQWKILLV